MGQFESNTIIKDELYEQYNWFQNSFLPALQQSCDDFFSDLFTFKLASLSKDINVLFQGDDYFVTKIRVNKQYDVFFRCSQYTIKLILENVLGSSEKPFELSQITELEAKIISSFNDYLYQEISHLISTPIEKKRSNFNMIHLTFFVKDKINKDGGKFIISLPEALLSPIKIQAKEEKFHIEDFKNSLVEVSIKVGTTKFPLKELKTIEKEDIVVFEDSDIQKMELNFNNQQQIFRITPNPGLIISLEENNGGQNMEENSLSQNLWDNIQVEMGAEFDKVKITLGELKNIEQGLVVDISSVYDNKISLKVENKTIARGELIIINDRYGVRIDEVFTSEEKPEEIYHNLPEGIEEVEVNEEADSESEEEEFDYSDFELEDEDI